MWIRELIKVPGSCSRLLNVIKMRIEHGFHRNLAIDDATYAGTWVHGVNCVFSCLGEFITNQVTFRHKDHVGKLDLVDKELSNRAVIIGSGLQTSIR